MAVAPIQFRPPVDSEKEFIGPPQDSEDEQIDVGVAIVGGGPAGLACAIRLSQLLETEPQLRDSLGEVPVALIEKGRNAGSHLMSGAVMRPSAMQELFPDIEPEDWPFAYSKVDKETVYFMTKRGKIPLKPTPPPFRNHGNYVISIAQLGRFLAEKAEEAGVYVLSETAATKLLVEEDVVRGVRTGDKGRGREGEERSNFEPGTEVTARATVLTEGTQGHLAGAAIRHFDLGSDDPPQWELGVKEVWEVPKALDRVIHTLGWPLRFSPKYREFGGSWIYPMGEDKISLGFVTGLDYRDATFSVHDVLQEFKTHKFVRKMLEGRQARRLGRQDHPLRWLLGHARAAVGPGPGHRRRLGLDGQRAGAQGRALRDARRHLRRRGDLRPAQARRGRRRPTSRPTTRVCAAAPSTRRSTARATCARSSPRGSSPAERWPT